MLIMINAYMYIMIYVDNARIYVCNVDFFCRR